MASLAITSATIQYRRDVKKESINRVFELNNESLFVQRRSGLKAFSGDLKRIITGLFRHQEGKA